MKALSAHRRQRQHQNHVVYSTLWVSATSKKLANMIAALLTQKAIENALAIGLAGGIIIVAAGFVVKSAVFFLNIIRIALIKLRIAWLTRRIRKLRQRK